MVSKALKEKAKKLKIKLTIKRKEKRVPKSEKVLKQQIENKMKYGKINYNKSNTPGIPALYMPGSFSRSGYKHKKGVTRKH